jgi:hypothetical protein
MKEKVICGNVDSTMYRYMDKVRIGIERRGKIWTEVIDWKVYRVSEVKFQAFDTSTLVGHYWSGSQLPWGGGGGPRKK